MKNINQFINEYIVKKKLDTPIDSEDHYKYFPETKEELIKNIKELIQNNIYDFNCIDTSEITDMSYLFKNLDDIEDNDFDVSNWDVSNVNNMDFMFYGCRSFKNNNLKKWNTNELKHTFNMFHNCTSLKNKPRLIRKK